MRRRSSRTWPGRSRSGPERGALELLAARLELADRVVFRRAGSPTRALGSGGIDVFALPSRLEALGLAAIEAMLAGLPVIASDTGGGSPRWSLDGESGLLVPAGDPGALAGAIRSLLLVIPNAADGLGARAGRSPCGGFRSQRWSPRVF